MSEITFIALWLLGLVSISSHADPLVLVCFKPLEVISETGTGVEVEPRIKGKHGGPLTPEAQAILALTEPENGKVGGLLSAKFISADLARKLAPFAGEGGVEQIDWDPLPPELKHELLVEATRHHKVRFERDRKVPGLLAKTRIKVWFPVDATLFGMKFEGGKNYEVDITPLVADRRIEYGGPDYVEDVSLFEFHFAIDGPGAGRFVHDVYQLMEAAGVHKDQTHVHVLAAIPRKALASQARRESLRYAEHWRRLNLAAEMVSIVDKGMSVKPVLADSGVVEWDSLRAETLYGMARDMELYLANGRLPYGDLYKMAYVSFHFPGKYRNPELCGYQFRNVSKRHMDVFEPLLSRAQLELQKRELGLSDEALDRWISSYSADTSVSKIAERLWYRGDNRPIAEPMRRPIQSDGAAEKLSSVEQNQREAGMLIYDWAHDPFVAQYPTVVERVTQLQESYFKRTLEQPYYARYFVKSFLRESGLYDLIVLNKLPQ